MAIKRCKISRKMQLRLLECFVLETTARAAANTLGMQANTAALFYHKIRQVIAAKLAEIHPEYGVFECDESYFGGVRKGKRGRGAAGKVPRLRHPQARRQGPHRDDPRLSQRHAPSHHPAKGRS